MVSDKIKWLVITDLDGSLLNHYDYGFDAALPAIGQLKKYSIPLILNTSKTYYETVEISRELDISFPFIVENGSSIYLPKKSFTELPSSFAGTRDNYWVIKLGSSVQEINRYLGLLVSDTDDFTLLSECSSSEVSKLTGLSITQSENAVKREFSQPMLWNGSDEQLADFVTRLEKQGLTLLQGGRFLHIQGKTNKGMAIKKLKTFYSNSVKTVVIGDSANDKAMLEVADISIVINAPGNKYLLKNFKPHYLTEEIAPKGWSEAIQYAFKRMI